MNIEKNAGRVSNMIRPINIKYDQFGNAVASVLFEQGSTIILVSITLQDGVPRFLKGKKQGWLSAEYVMLPCATSRRVQRDFSSTHKNARSVEISRLIGRTLRTVIDFSVIPDKSIIIDCDVLTADGGTRVASITAASVALKLAQSRWLEAGIIQVPVLKEDIAAISVGKVFGNLVLDLDFSLDSNASADFNFIMTRSGKLIEIQGTAEKEPLELGEFEGLKNLASLGIKQVFEFVDKFDFTNLSTKNYVTKNSNNLNNKSIVNKANKKVPLFSLANRVNSL